MTDAGTLAQALRLRKSGDIYVGACPLCGYDGSFSARNSGGRVLVFCHACRDQDGILDALRGLGLWTGSSFGSTADPSAAGTARSSTASDRIQYAKQLWAKGMPCAGSPVEKYLRGRGITLSVPPTLRYIRRLRHRPSGTYWHAMIGAVAEGVSQTIAGVHRTYIRPDGSGKASVTPQKMTLGRVVGNVVKLAPAGPTLAVAEGIETALSVMQATGLPAWAALSAGNLPRLHLPPPDLVREIHLFSDHDHNGTGQTAAYEAAERWTLQGRRVRVVLPPIGVDFNDMLAEAVP